MELKLKSNQEKTECTSNHAFPNSEQKIYHLSKRNSKRSTEGSGDLGKKQVCLESGYKMT